MFPEIPQPQKRYSRTIGRARMRRMAPGLPHEWLPVLDVHPTEARPDPLPNYVWLQLGERIRAVPRRALEFWYDTPGCALTDAELTLLRRLAIAEQPIMFQVEGRTAPALLAFDELVDVLRDLRKAGWIVLEVWPAEKGQRGHIRRRFVAAQATCTPSGLESLEQVTTW
jgi:hypothetical protein